MLKWRNKAIGFRRSVANLVPHYKDGGNRTQPEALAPLTIKTKRTPAMGVLIFFIIVKPAVAATTRAEIHFAENADIRIVE